MKIQTKALVAGLVALAIVGTAFAQGAGPRGGGFGEGQGGGPGGRGMRRGPMGFDQEILAKLALNAAQTKRVADLKKTLGESAKAAMQKSQGDRGAQMAAVKAIGKKYRDGMEKILTPAQMTQYKALMKARREEMKKRMGNRGGGAGAPSN